MEARAGSWSVAPLTPLAYLERSALVFDDRVAVVDGDRRLSYADLHDRASRLAGLVRSLGAAPGDRVAVLAPNSLPLLEAHYGVPLAGAILVALNVRLTGEELAELVAHSGARVLVTDASYLDRARVVAAHVRGLQILVAGAGGDLDAGRGELSYEDALRAARPFSRAVDDELSPISINYTSGTTGTPKGVVYTHRGAYLQALAMAYHLRLDSSSVFLWTLPMFHCNGWCCTWAVTAAGGRHVCLRKVEAETVWRMVDEEGVTHFNAAPTVLASLLEGGDASRRSRDRRVRVATGGAPPWPSLLERLSAAGVDLTHLYGLTETYGPAVVCEWRPEWSSLDPQARASLLARQGVGNVVSLPVRVVDADGRDVPADGSTVGEIALRGNNVMAGYFRDDTATASAIPDGWFRSGDLGVMHEHGYVEITDRAKDVIISGGENVASVEVERVLAAHPAVQEAAVVAWPDERWGEVPAAFVTLRPGEELGEEALIEFARRRLAHFKAPKHVVFGPLPKTSTGKVEKFVLRERARELAQAGRGAPHPTHMATPVDRRPEDVEEVR